jgi:hypothetical protein
MALSNSELAAGAITSTNPPTPSPQSLHLCLSMFREYAGLPLSRNPPVTPSLCSIHAPMSQPPPFQPSAFNVSPARCIRADIDQEAIEQASYAIMVKTSALAMERDNIREVSVTRGVEKRPSIRSPFICVPLPTGEGPARWQLPR